VSIPATGVPLSSPYKGLAPFEDSDLDALLFFGRDWETEVVAANVLAARLTVLYGPSGVGKSSLLRAGVVRALRQSGDPAPAVVVFGTWAGEPLTGLEEAARAAVAEALGREPIDAPGGLTDRLAAWSAELGSELCLLIDQLEELFLYHPAKEGAAGFVDLLPELVLRPGLRVNVLLGIRDDALAQLDVFKERIPGLFMNSLRLDHLDRTAGREAILGPLGRFAAIAGAVGAMEIEPELVDEVLDEVAAGRIEPAIAGVGAVEGMARAGRIETPYLQLVLQRLWEVERERGSRVMRLETFRSLGGAERIVQNHLERALRALSPAEQAAAASVFGHLVTPSGSKIAHGTSDLATYASLGEEEIKPVLDSLARQRILRPLGENGHAGDRYEIFHDVLAGAVLAWSTRHEADAALEEERKRRRRLGWLAAVALVGLALMAALAAYAFSQRSEAQKQSAEASAQRTEAERSEDKARKAREVAENQALVADEQAEKAEEAKAKARQEAAHAHAAEAKAKKLEALATSGEQSAERAKVAAIAAQADAEIQAEDARQQRQVAQGQTRKARAARAKADRARNRAEARLYIARSVGLVRSDPESSASFAIRAAGLAKTQDDRVDAANALRAALVAMRVQHILPGAGAGSGAGAESGTFARLSTSRATDGARVAHFSADGRRVVVAVGGGSPFVRIYRARDGRLLKIFRASSTVNDAALSADGKFAAAAGADGKVYVWNVDKRSVRTLDHESPVSRVAWSPAGDVLASVGLGANPSARLWDPANGDLLHSLQHSAPLEAAIFSPDGRRIATYGAGHLVRIFDVRTGVPVRTLEHPVSALPVTSAAFGPAGDLIATSRGNFARLWDVETGVQRVVYEPHTRTVTDVAFSPTGEQIATASIDTIARIWNTATGALVTTTSGHAGLGINDVDFSPDVDAHAIVTAGADGTMRYSAPGQDSISLLGHDSAVLSASFSPNGRSILSASADGTARLWDPYGEPAPKALKKYSSDVTAVAVDPTGSRIAVGREDGGVEVLSPGRRVISTPVTGRRRTVSVGWAGETTLMAATSAGRVRIWGDSGRGPVRELLHGSGIRAAAISRDGKQAATAGQDGVVRLWRLPSGTFQTLKHDAAVNAVDFDETGRFLASASGKQAFVWRTSDGERVKPFDPGSEAGDVTGVAFGDGGRLATSDKDGMARIWSVRSGLLVNTLVRHGGKIAGLSFSPDGRWLATAGLRKAGVWQVGKSDLDGHFLFFVAPPRDQQGPLTSIAFTRNHTIVMGTSHTDGVPYGAVRSYRCRFCGGLPELVAIAKGKLAHLQAEARR
jgi:WD40 repeat protein